MEDATALEAAALRGLRSLILRGGYDADTGLTPSLSSLAQVLGSTTALVAYVGDDDGRVLGWDVGRRGPVVRRLAARRDQRPGCPPPVVGRVRRCRRRVLHHGPERRGGRAGPRRRRPCALPEPRHRVGCPVLAVSPTARHLLELDADARPVSRDGLVGTIGDAVRTLIEG